MLTAILKVALFVVKFSGIFFFRCSVFLATFSIDTFSLRFSLSLGSLNLCISDSSQISDYLLSSSS